MSDTIVKLFYVQHEIANGDSDGLVNWDLIVIAKDENQAIELWREHNYEPDEVERDDEGNITYDGNNIKKDTMPTRIWTIPVEEMLARVPRALAWRNIQSIDY